MPQELIMHRNRVIRTLSGHSIQFVKGEPVSVPDTAIKECVALGAVFAKGSEVPEAAVALLEDVPPKLQDVPKTPAERKKRILGLFREMIANQEAHRTHFAASGRPRARYVSDILNFDVPTQEIEEHWTALISPNEDDDAG